MYLNIMQMINILLFIVNIWLNIYLLVNMALTIGALVKVIATICFYSDTEKKMHAYFVR